jgi:hypothetical protein
MKRLLILLCLFILASGYVYADDVCTFSVKFHNNTPERVIYSFSWIDHPFEIALPFHMAGGELGSDEAHTIRHVYTCGEYMVIWTVGDHRIIRAFSHREWHDKIRILTPVEEM